MKNSRIELVNDSEVFFSTNKLLHLLESNLYKNIVAFILTLIRYERCEWILKKFLINLTFDQQGELLYNVIYESLGPQIK
jgi:hypothetical protein